jgi:hypothetical protein
VRDDVLAHEPDPFEVDPQLLFPLALVELPGRNAARDDPVVDDQDVDLPEFGDRRLGQPACTVGGGHVGLYRHAPSVEFLDQLVRLGGPWIGRVRKRLADVADDDVGAFSGEPPGVTAALAAGPTGDQCDLAVQ